MSRLTWIPAERGLRWPDFTLFNQQGNRWTQNRTVTVWPNGRALYFERFSTVLQAPDFNFRSFPFDRQQFFIRVDALNPVEYYVFTNLPGFSEVGKQLGEEEWVVKRFNTIISQEITTTQSISARFSFRFQAQRRLNYYILRIFIPLCIIVLVSWTTFFLRDYAKRIDISGANLLLFIAFNFTISNDLPKLGYLTYIDLILVSAFGVTSLVFICSVYLRRLEIRHNEALLHKVDTYMTWISPLAYIVAVVTMSVLFL